MRNAKNTMENLSIYNSIKSNGAFQFTYVNNSSARKGLIKESIIDALKVDDVKTNNRGGLVVQVYVKTINTKYLYKGNEVSREEWYKALGTECPAEAEARPLLHFRVDKMKNINVK